jgi:hypothetical protein
MTATERAKESKSGKMVLSIRVTGKMTRQMERADSSMLMATSMRVSGITIKPREGAPTNTQMAPSILVIGRKIDSTVTALKPGQTMPSTRATTSKERSTALELSNGLIPLRTSVSFIIITFMARASTRGPTEEFTRANGEPTKCTEKALLPGRMAGSMSESTVKTRKEVMENSSGQMVAATEESGTTVNNTEKDPTLRRQVRKSMASGRTEKGFDGLELANKIELRMIIFEITRVDNIKIF